MSMVRKGMVCLVSAAVFLASTAAMAMPVLYSEDIDGDIHDTSPVFHFDIGTNVISGSNSIIKDMPGLVGDFDDIRFTIPAEAVLSAVTFSFSNVQILGAALGPGFQPNLQDVPFTFGTSTSFGASGTPPFSLFSGKLPLPEGTYRFFDVESYTWVHTPRGGFTYDYSVSFDVSPVEVSAVPVPAALPLFLSALSVLGLIFRRRRRPKSI